MSTLPSLSTRCAPRRLPLRQTRALLLAVGVAAGALGAIMAGAGLGTIPTLPPRSPLAVEHVLAEGIAPGTARGCPCPSPSSPEVAHVAGIAMHRESTGNVDRRPSLSLTTKALVMRPRPAPAHLRELEAGASTFSGFEALAAMPPHSDVTSWDGIRSSSPTDRRAYLLVAAMQVHAPAAAEPPAGFGRYGTQPPLPTIEPGRVAPFQVELRANQDESLQSAWCRRSPRYCEATDRP